MARFAWNWALAEWQRQYAAHRADPTQPKPAEGALRRQLNALKREQFPWMLEVTKCAPQEAIINLGTAYKNWFASLAGKRKGPKVQAPKFKKKGRCKDSFKIHGTQTAVDGSRLRIPNLGWVRMRETLRFTGTPVSVTVSRTADAWFAAITVETDDPPLRCESQAAVGIDLGLKALVTLSDGRSFAGPKALGMLLQRLRRLSRAHSRKVKGSANRKKSALRLARLHWRIECVRNDALHKLTHQLTRDYGWLAIEDLHVKGLLANGKLARHLTDAAFGEFRRQLTYKAVQRGSTVAAVDRWYPSSKTCSVCGAIHAGLTLADRRWTCPVCGTEHDRDENAATNILAESLRQAKTLAAGAVATACPHGDFSAIRLSHGAESAGSGRQTRTKLSATKQEAKDNLASTARL